MASRSPATWPAADILVTAAPAELGEHTKALADAAKILNRTGVSWTMHQGGFDASNIGFNNGDLELQERLTRSLIDTAVKIGAKTVLLPECGHAYGAARWEAAKWYGAALPVRIVHMTEFLDELIAAGRIRVKTIGETATFHDPCQIVRRGGLEAAARRVLAALGFELIELQDHGVTGFCCGGGGGVVSNQRAAPLRHKVFEMKKRRSKRPGPSTSSPVAASAASRWRWAPSSGLGQAHRKPARAGGRPIGRLSSRSGGLRRPGSGGGSHFAWASLLAERVGFEPTDGCPSLVFKTSAIDHSAISPEAPG